MCDDFRKCQVWRFNIEVAFDNLQVRGYLTQELVRFFVGEVAKAQNLTDLARTEELLELFDWLSVGHGRKELSQPTFAGISYNTDQPLSTPLATR